MTQPIQPDQGTSLDTHLEHTLTFGGKTQEPGVAMSEPQYQRIQARIRQETARKAATSIWLALAFAFASFGASAAVALGTLPEQAVSDTVRGRLQAAVVGASVLVFLCLAVHGATWTRGRTMGHDICLEMDIYCHRKSRAAPRRWWSRPRSGQPEVHG